MDDNGAVVCFGDLQDVRSKSQEADESFLVHRCDRVIGANTMAKHS